MDDRAVSRRVAEVRETALLLERLRGVLRRTDRACRVRLVALRARRALERLTVLAIGTVIAVLDRKSVV